MNTENPSIIKMYGEVLTDKEFLTNPAISRDEEINQMILALITPDKSALLVGKPGIGKTALVEGLAYRISKGLVPPILAGWKIIKINVPALLGKIIVNGVEVSKLQVLISELDNVEKTILFIDEVHLLASRNTDGEVDFANMLKPYLDRGRILMIGATTSEEYEQYILRDRAFVRRFIKIDVAELQGDAVVQVLLGTVPKFEQKMGIKLNYSDYQQEKIFPHFIGAAIEYPGFINDLTGWENLLLLAGIKKFIGKEEINEILEVVGLSKDKDKKYGTYSLGMRQKLSLAQALMEKPLIILLDEPFNGIDRASVKKIKEYLVLQKEEDKALIIITTHIKDDLEDLVDEKLYLEDGKLYEEESTNYK